MHCFHVPFHFFSAPSGNDGSPLGVNEQHSPFCFRAIKTEVGAKNVGDVRHEVDRVVPDQDDPRMLELDYRASVRGGGDLGHQVPFATLMICLMWFSIIRLVVMLVMTESG